LIRKGKVELGKTYRREKKLSRKSFVNCSRLLMCNRNYAVRITQKTTNANATKGAIKLTTSNVYIVYRTNNMTIATFRGLTLTDSKLGISE